MEFHNVKLLPKGLPEIIAQFVPYEIYPDTKVIVYPRKGMGLEDASLGYAGYDNLTSSYHIGLYPTMCCSGGGRGYNYASIPSFRLWMGMLTTTLHEIGHLVTWQVCIGLPAYEQTFNDTHCYVERLADEWMESAMARILRVDPRLGQPDGALTGYPGMLAYRLRNCGRPWNGEHYYPRVLDWRGLKCGGQIPLSAIIYRLASQVSLKRDSKFYLRFAGVVRRWLHEGSKQLQINRHFISATGRRYLMFNVGEAEAVYHWLFEDRRVYDWFEKEAASADIGGK
jgi:hypothetical protein